MSVLASHILVVDDSPEDRLAYRRWLQADVDGGEFVISEASSGVEGLRLFSEVKPDCVLLDFQLPDLSGIEFLDRLDQEFELSECSVIMLTGHGNEKVAVQALKNGADDYLIKANEGGPLCKAVHSGLEKLRLRRQVNFQSAEVARLTAERIQLIADLREKADALTLANERKDEFLATLAHELRNPLAPIRNSLQILRMSGSSGESSAHIYEMMDRQVDHMVRLVDDLLEISRITRGKIELRKERIELADLIRNAVETSKPLVDAAKHQLTVDLPPESLPLHVDGVRIAQVFANLINNAAKYTESGGRISITALRNGDEVAVSVIDNGVGIPSEMIPRVFDLFTQVDRHLGRAQGGLGIGLALVRQLIEMHGGSVEARSEGPRRGSEFVVRLPLASAPGDGSTEVVGESRSEVTAPRRVLVVDDNRDSAVTMAMLLGLMGAETNVAYDGRSALEVLDLFRPAVVLLDIGMEGMDGCEVARRIRQRTEYQDLILVAVTGWGQPEDRRRTQAAGFNHHLVKPVNADALRALMISLQSANT
ncbi:MAG: response regulator [Planctomycetia bacterium]|nr:response regulator [Planctomycetia bacterium]